MYNPRMAVRLVLTAVMALLATACAQRDLLKDLQLVDVRTGWYDMGVVKETGENKLVPSISLKLKNVSQEEIGGVELNAVFRNNGDPDPRGDHFVSAISSRAPLPSGESSKDIVLRSKIGYTGTESRAQMLKNTHFVDRNVTILVKHGRTNWTRLAVIPIERQLLTQ